MTDVGSIQNISGENRELRSIGSSRLVLADQVIEIPLDQVTSYTQQETTWAPYDEAAKAAHRAMLDGIAELIAAETKAQADAEADQAERDAAYRAAAEAAQAARAATYAAVIERAATAQARIDLVTVGGWELASAVLADEQARKTPRASVIEAAESRINDDDAQEG